MKIFRFVVISAIGSLLLAGCKTTKSIPEPEHYSINHLMIPQARPLPKILGRHDKFLVEIVQLKIGTSHQGFFENQVKKNLQENLPTKQKFLSYVDSSWPEVKSLERIEVPMTVFKSIKKELLEKAEIPPEVLVEKCKREVEIAAKAKEEFEERTGKKPHGKLPTYEDLMAYYQKQIDSQFKKTKLGRMLTLILNMEKELSFHIKKREITGWASNSENYMMPPEAKVKVRDNSGTVVINNLNEWVVISELVQKPTRYNSDYTYDVVAVRLSKKDQLKQSKYQF